jgi:hypothetical protein
MRRKGSPDCAARRDAHLVGESLLVFEAVGLVTDEEVAGLPALELVRVQPERLIGHY